MIISMEGNRLRVGTEPNKTRTSTGMRTAPSAGHIVCNRFAGTRTAPSADHIVCTGFAGIRTAPSAGRIGHNKKRGLFLVMHEHRFPLAHRTSGIAIALAVLAVVRRAFEANWHK
jgi:hypothetical protein